MTAGEPEVERVDCPDCFALPGRDNTRFLVAKRGGGVREWWHTPDCPELTIMQITGEEGRKRILEQNAWAEGVFPAARERLNRAAAAMPAGSSARPFVDALVELVQAQADAGGGFVVLHQWAEILERHFPPELPDPGHVTE